MLTTRLMQALLKRAILKEAISSLYHIWLCTQAQVVANSSWQAQNVAGKTQDQGMGSQERGSTWKAPAMCHQYALMQVC